MSQSNEWLRTMLDELVDAGISNKNNAEIIMQSFGESTLRDDFIGTKTLMDNDIFAPEWQEYMDSFSHETRLRVENATDAKNKALDAFQSGNMVAACMAFMELGIAIENVKGLANKEQKELLLGYGENIERTQQLKKDKTHERMLRLQANYLAQGYWGKDENHSIRMSEMVQKILPELVEFAQRQSNHVGDIKKSIPKENALKEWLKPKAPEWASKRGRPQNI